jgi:murein L,D-transpeptidase YcbB/YkuD
MKGMTRLAGALAVLALLSVLPPPVLAESRIKTEAIGRAGPPDEPPSEAEDALASELNRLLADGGADLPEGAAAVALWDFYAGRGFAPIWTTAAGPNAAGSAALDTLAAIADNAAAEASSRVAPLLGAATSRSVNPDPAALAEFELLVSAAVLAAAIDPEQPWIAAADAGALAAAGDSASFDAYLPPDPAFWRLRAMIGVYETMMSAGPWPTVAAGPKLEPAAKDARIVELRHRLAATGDLSDSAPADPEFYDESLVEDVKRFQARHGLAADAVVGFSTIDALNATVEQRLATMLFNLRRLQRDARHWPRSHVTVNIAAAQMRLVQDGKTTMDANVIVGRVDRPTPLIDSAVNRVEFNPFWTVPPNIAAKDLLPKIRKDKKFLENNNFKVYASWESANEVDPDSIEWTSGAARRLRLRQDPGPENALGPAKFLFPNKYDVYLHGTNKPELFQKTDRFLSSGCIRLSDPIGFAELLLKDNPDWTAERIAAALKSGRNQGLTLAPTLPVHLIYLTAWVDDDGVMQFRKDVYGKDKPEPLPAPPAGTNS